MKLPVKAGAVRFAINIDRDFELDELVENLKKEYPGERICSREQIQDYVDALVGAGIMQGKDLKRDADGKLSLRYEITPYGKTLKKYFK